MDTFGLIVVAVAVGACGSWPYLLLLRGCFWRANVRLECTAPDLGQWPAVAIIIPARNEVAVVGQAIRSHLCTAYPGARHIILVDDGSDDGTAEASAAASSGRQHALTVVEARPTPPGWTGKLWALHQGIETARRAMPHARYLLLTDADIVHGPQVLRSLVTKAENEGRVLVSLMALLDDRGFWAGLLIPAFVFFFQKLYPFAWVNGVRRRTAAAAGGCMLVDRAALDRARGPGAVRGELIDDCALARLLKEAERRQPIWLGLTRDVVSVRANGSLRDVWNMVARTAYTQLGRSPVVLAGTIVGMSLLYGAGPVLLLTWPAHGNAIAGMLGLAAWAAMVVAFAPTLRLYRRPWWQGAALPLSAVLYTLMTVSSAWRHWRGRGGSWKGRHYATSLNGHGIANHSKGTRIHD